MHLAHEEKQRLLVVQVDREKAVIILEPSVAMVENW